MDRLCERLLRRIAVAGIAVLAAGCGSATELAVDGPVYARAVDGQVAVTNGSEREIFTTMFGLQSSALIDWVACVEGPACQPLGSGMTRTASVHAIEGIEETHAIVYWWHAVAGMDGVTHPDSIRWFRVKL